jgi:release factor glutamine methyltransferase
MSTYQQLQRDIAARLADRFGPDALREARYIVALAAGFDQAGLIAAGNDAVPADISVACMALTARRVTGEPLSRIRGVREFYGREFLLSPATLDPRPDSETVIEAALDWAKLHGQPQSVLDLGTGSGCLLLTLLSEWKQARGIGVDLSFDAVKIARANAEKLGVRSAQLIQGNWATAIKPGSIDMIVANPPYIPSQVIHDLEPEVKNFDPILALDGGQDGLMSYKTLVHECKRILTASGVVFFEIGIGQENDVIRLGVESGATQARTHVDSGGITRVVEMHYGDN